MLHNKLNKISAVFLAWLLVLGILAGCSENAAGSADKSIKDYSSVADNPNISIPGYEKLEFSAGKKKQNVSFHNPEENTCYFRMTLELENVSEEENVLWTSELIEPGEEIKNIKLSRKLEDGDYAAVLKYECFSLKDETPLNGSAIELTIDVR